MLVQLLGYLGLSLLMMSCIPQSIRTIKQGHADGMTVFYLVCLVVGFIVLIAYVCLLPKTPIPLLINYIINLISYSIITYYKFYPKQKNKMETTNV
jgi:uncharacterized protein with PQ loop repeat